MEAEDVVRNYKRLAGVEQAFRSLKTLSLNVRPIRHYKTRRGISHVLVCMLAYYVEWHMKQRLAPMLEALVDTRPSVVHAAQCSAAAEQKARTTAMSFATLMAHLGALSQHTIVPKVPVKQVCSTQTLGEVTATQRRAFDLLRVKLR